MNLMKFQKFFSNSVFESGNRDEDVINQQVSLSGKSLKLKSRVAVKQSGSSMIEALVSLLVFSVGALGIAALQTVSVVRGDDTRARSVVLWKAQEVIDRMKSTKTVNNVNGQLNIYLATIGNNADNIGIFNDNNGDGIADNQNLCAAQPTACDTQACNAQEMVAFDLWDVFCNVSTGLAPTPVAAGAVPDGLSAVRNLEVALVQNGNEYQLYFEWLNRAASNNIDEDGGPDTGLGGGRTVQTNLCGNIVAVDARLDAYCVRFQ